MTGNMSLTARLTLLFVLVSSAVLLALGLVIAGSVEQHFEEQDMEVLTAKMERTRQALGLLSALSDVPELMGALDNALVGHHGLAVVVMDAKQRTLFANFGMNWPKAGEVDTALRSPMTPVLWTLDGQTYRAVVAPVATGLLDAPVVTVVVALDTVHHQQFMTMFQRTLWAFIAGAAALCSVLGWVAVRRGLAPLRTMRDQTSGVTAKNLNYRLPLERLPRYWWQGTSPARRPTPGSCTGRKRCSR